MCLLNNDIVKYLIEYKIKRRTQSKTKMQNNYAFNSIINAHVYEFLIYSTIYIEERINYYDSI